MDRPALGPHDHCSLPLSEKLLDKAAKVAAIAPVVETLNGCDSFLRLYGRSLFMILRRTTLVASAIVLVLTGNTVSDAVDNEQGIDTPHGGVVQQGNGMQVEFRLDKNGKPKAYLYDQAMKALQRSEIQVKATAAGHDGIQHERDLKFVKDPKEGPLFEGEPIKGLTHWHVAVVSIKSKGQWSHVRFSNH